MKACLIMNMPAINTSSAQALSSRQLPPWATALGVLPIAGCIEDESRLLHAIWRWHTCFCRAAAMDYSMIKTDCWYY